MKEEMSDDEPEYSGEPGFQQNPISGIGASAPKPSTDRGNESENKDWDLNWEKIKASDEDTSTTHGILSSTGLNTADAPNDWFQGREQHHFLILLFSNPALKSKTFLAKYPINCFRPG